MDSSQPDDDRKREWVSFYPKSTWDIETFSVKYHWNENVSLKLLSIKYLFQMKYFIKIFKLITFSVFLMLI